MVGTIFGISKSYWIVDTGTTDHMTSHKDWLFDLKVNSTTSIYIHLPNGVRSIVTHIGSCTLASHQYL